MALRLRGNTYWVDITINKERHRVSTETTDQETARNFEREYVRNVKAGKVTLTTKSTKATKEMTLETAIARMEKTEWKKAKSLATHLNNINIVAGIIGKTIQLRDITQRVVGDLKYELMEIYEAEATVNRKLASLQRILRVAARDWGVLDAVPMFSKLKEDNARKRVLSEAEEERVFAKLYEYDEVAADYLKLLLYSGCRLSEPLSVRKDNIDFPEGVFWVDHKTDSFTQLRRPIIMNGVTSAIMHKYFDSNIDAFRGINRFYIRRVFMRALKACQLENSELVVHSLRHTFATRLVNSGVELNVVQVLLGHSNISTTTRYAKLNLETLSSAAKRLDVRLAA